MTIYEEKNAEMYGKEVTLLVDETEGDTRICRSQWDSPEVDMNYYVKRLGCKTGRLHSRPYHRRPVIRL